MGKMLQIQPEVEIIIELIRNEDYKYVRLLGAFYMRLSGKDNEVYQYLEPLYNDYRKIRLMSEEGTFLLSSVDEIIDDLLRKDIVFDTTMPRIQYRYILESQGRIGPRLSLLSDET